jgi:hypothetical protein
LLSLLSRSPFSVSLSKRSSGRMISESRWTLRGTDTDVTWISERLRLDNVQMIQSSILQDASYHNGSVMAPALSRRYGIGSGRYRLQNSRLGLNVLLRSYSPGTGGSVAGRGNLGIQVADRRTSLPRHYIERPGLPGRALKRTNNLSTHKFISLRDHPLVQ